DSRWYHHCRHHAAGSPRRHSRLRHRWSRRRPPWWPRLDGRLCRSH
ncbi:hypothetical protein BN1708_019111, partial [Verticillium longisporum]